MPLCMCALDRVSKLLPRTPGRPYSTADVFSQAHVAVNMQPKAHGANKTMALAQVSGRGRLTSSSTSAGDGKSSHTREWGADLDYTPVARVDRTHVGRGVSAGGGSADKCARTRATSSSA